MNRFRVNHILKFFLMTFYYKLDRFVMDVATRYDRPGKKLLDIGAETSPYRSYFTQVSYYAHDIKQDKKHSFDYTGDLNKRLSTPSESMDYILCTQVLEHVQKPHKAFEEFNRILKRNGKLFLTTNFLYQIHMEPHDYYRFTKYGLYYLGEAHGFKVIHLAPQGGIFHVLSYIITTAPIRLFFEDHPKGALIYIGLFSPIIAFINLTTSLLDRFDRDKRLTINYEVIYEKV